MSRQHSFVVADMFSPHCGRYIKVGMKPFPEDRKMSRQHSFVVCKSTDLMYVLCQDNRWRRLPHFGTCRGCVKVYWSFSWACRKAKHIDGNVYRADYWQNLVALFQDNYV